MSSDLTGFISLLRKKGLLSEINVPVDSVYEAGEIASQVVAKGGNALLFSNIKGSDFPLFMNAFGTAELMCHALGVDSISDLAKLGEHIFDPYTLCGKTPFSSAFSVKKYLGVFPNVIPEPKKLIAEHPNFSKLPALKTYPLDGGKFITTAITVLKDPETNVQNKGLYRLQIFSDGRLGLHFHKNKDGAKILQKYRNRNKKMPVSIAVGVDPLLLYCASAPLPMFFDEFRFAGLIKGAPIKLRKSRLSDLLVPAHSHFVFEGYCDPNETRLEGPFGDHTGYYSEVSEHAVFTPLLTVRQKHPIFTATVTGAPLKEDYFLGFATERLFLPTLKLMCNEINDIHFFPEGVFHGALTVSVNDTSFSAVRKVFNFIWGSGQLCTSKFIVAVDKDVDIFDRTAVLWRIFNNVDYEKDIVISKGALDDLDTSSGVATDFGKMGARIGIDATSKRRGTAQVKAEVPPAIKQLVRNRWNDYGIF